MKITKITIAAFPEISTLRHMIDMENCKQKPINRQIWILLL